MQQIPRKALVQHKCDKNLPDSKAFPVGLRESETLGYWMNIAHPVKGHVSRKRCVMFQTKSTSTCMKMHAADQVKNLNEQNIQG